MDFTSMITKHTKLEFMICKYKYYHMQDKISQVRAVQESVRGVRNAKVRAQMIRNETGRT